MSLYENELEKFKSHGLEAHFIWALGYRKKSETYLIAAELFSSGSQLMQGIGASALLAEHAEAFYKSSTGYMQVEQLFLKNQNPFGREKLLDDLSAFYGSSFAGYRRIATCLLKRNLLGKAYILTTSDDLIDDVYSSIICNFNVIVEKQWMPVLLDSLKKKGNIQIGGKGYENDIVLAGRGRSIPIGNGRTVALDDLVFVDLSELNDTIIRETISLHLKNGTLEFENKNSSVKGIPSSLDALLVNYSEELINSKNFESWEPIVNQVDHASLMEKRPFPQQATAVNGVVSHFERGNKYAFFTCQMGTGKTLMGYLAVEEYFNRMYLKKHPGLTLEGLYKNPPKDLTYRVMVMCPGHLLEKWKKEVSEQIYGAKTYVINWFEDLVRMKDRKVSGKEWYFMGKDFAKLSYSNVPAPKQFKYRIPVTEYCETCFNNHHELVYKYTSEGGKCRKCNSNKWLKKPLSSRSYEGMVCPECGDLLYKPSAKLFSADFDDNDDLIKASLLKPSDFDVQRDSNSVCAHCGCRLWMPNIKNISIGDKDQVPKREGKKWLKLKYYKNKKHKSTNVAWTLEGHEVAFLHDKNLTMDELVTNNGELVRPAIGKIRRTSPAQYIKKYINLDMCILDEAHKYEGAGSAQATAAHALICKSKHVMCLTGTLTNGSALSLFYIMYMLDPARMKRLGFDHDEGMAFCEKYGSIETQYEYSKNISLQEYKKSSRGKVVSNPRVKPGISPAVFADLLMDNSIFLELADFSKYMPSLEEKAIFVQAPEELKKEFDRGLCQLVNCIREHPKNLADVLQFGLSYLDKPYDLEPIRSGTETEVLSKLGIVLLNPIEFPQYEKDELLPKDKELIRIINEEMSLNRNVFVFATNTGKAEWKVTDRLKEEIEQHCNLKGRVYVLESMSPEAKKREEFIKEKASQGIRVFICNPKLVETGLDFCFKHKGVEYNYPTIVFYEVSYELAVMWQASGRAWRLNQHELCKTYYLGYESSPQQVAIRLMAKKKQAAMALQGNLSADSFMGMTAGVDGRQELAKAIMENSETASANEVAEMFDVLNKGSVMASDDNKSNYTPPKTVYEIIGNEEDDMWPDGFNVFGIDFEQIEKLNDILGENTQAVVSGSDKTKSQKMPEKVASENATKLVSKSSSLTVNTIVTGKMSKKVQKEKKLGQMSIFDMLGKAI